MQNQPLLPLLRQQASTTGYLTYAQFTEAALYHPESGYYASQRNRVGKSNETDFYTSTSLGPLFGQLVVEAACTLLSPKEPKDYVFVEIAAEPGSSILDSVPHPFAQSKTLRLGDPLTIDGKTVVFANEWLDAQPFHRLLFQGGTWREIVVREKDGKLVESLLETPSPCLQPWLDELPSQHIEGYHLDIPSGAQASFRALLAKPWEGLFLTLDYGKRMEALLHDTPQGTARAYKNHQQSPGLLAQPGQQDLTCHLCWDWLEKEMEDAGFEGIQLLRQESLFMRYSQQTLRETLERPGSTEDKGRIKELLHPAHLGNTFQALCGIRTKKY